MVVGIRILRILTSLTAIDHRSGEGIINQLEILYGFDKYYYHKHDII